MAPGDDVLLRQLVTVRGVQHHHRLDRLTPVVVLGGDDAGLLDRRVAKHQGLDLGRPDLEAGCVDHAFEPVGDEEITVFVDPTQIAGPKKPLALQFDKGRRRGLRPLPVTQQVLRTAHDDFTLLADRHFQQRVGVHHTRVGAHVGDTQALLLGGVLRIEMRGRGGFGQAVTFGVTQAVVVEQALCHRLRHGRTAAANLHQRR